MDNTHDAWDWLVGLELLTLDVSPAPADFTVGGTVTGGTSTNTCVVVAVIDSDNYLIKDRDGDFDDGEVLSDGVNSGDQGVGFPTVAKQNVFGAVAADEGVPKYLRDKISAIQAAVIAGGSGQLTREDLGFLGQALSYLGANVH